MKSINSPSFSVCSFGLFAAPAIVGIAVVTSIGAGIGVGIAKALGNRKSSVVCHRTKVSKAKAAARRVHSYTGIVQEDRDDVSRPTARSVPLKAHLPDEPEEACIQKATSEEDSSQGSAALGAEPTNPLHPRADESSDVGDDTLRFGENEAPPAFRWKPKVKAVTSTGPSLDPEPERSWNEEDFLGEGLNLGGDFRPRWMSTLIASDFDPGQRRASLLPGLCLLPIPGDGTCRSVRAP